MTTCEHKNLTSQGFWVRCADCGAARLGEHADWITSSVQLMYLDIAARDYAVPRPSSMLQKT